MPSDSRQGADKEIIMETLKSRNNVRRCRPRNEAMKIESENIDSNDEKPSARRAIEAAPGERRAMTALAPIWHRRGGLRRAGRTIGGREIGAYGVARGVATKAVQLTGPTWRDSTSARPLLRCVLGGAA